jgi:hypothetical protein
MMLRVWALWHKDKRIIGILMFFIVVQVAFTGMALGYTRRLRIILSPRKDQLTYFQ